MYIIFADVFNPYLNHKKLCKIIGVSSDASKISASPRMAFAINNKNWLGKLIRMYIQALQFYGPKSNVSREKNFRYKIKSKTFNDIQLLFQHETFS